MYTSSIYASASSCSSGKWSNCVWYADIRKKESYISAQKPYIPAQKALYKRVEQLCLVCGYTGERALYFRQRALYSHQKNPCVAPERETTVFRVQVHVRSVKEPCISAKEPYIPAKWHYISKELYIYAKEPSIYKRVSNFVLLWNFEQPCLMCRYTQGHNRR